MCTLETVIYCERGIRVAARQPEDAPVLVVRTLAQSVAGRCILSLFHCIKYTNASPIADRIDPLCPGVAADVHLPGVLLSQSRREPGIRYRLHVERMSLSFC